MFDTIWWCCTIAWINKYRTLLRCWKSHRNFPQLDHVDHVCIIYQLLSSANKWRILIVWGKSGTVSEIIISRGSLNQQGGGMRTILLIKKFYNYVDSGNCFSKLFFSLLNIKNNLSWPKICMQIKKICSTLYR